MDIHKYYKHTNNWRCLGSDANNKDYKYDTIITEIITENETKGAVLGQSQPTVMITAIQLVITFDIYKSDYGHCHYALYTWQRAS